MSEPFTTTGGARIGRTSVTWPFARLSATADQLTISTFFFGNYVFNPAEVIGVQSHIRVPGLGWGIRIRHCRPEYPEKIIFWCFGNPATLLRRISEVGFIPSAQSCTAFHRSGLAVRLPIVIVGVGIWNALVLVDMARSNAAPSKPGSLTLIAMLLVLLSSIAALIFPALQRLILKTNRSFREIRAFMVFLAFASGFMWLFLLIICFFRG